MLACWTSRAFHSGNPQIIWSRSKNPAMQELSSCAHATKHGSLPSTRPCELIRMNKQSRPNNTTYIIQLFYGWIYSIAIKHTSISLGLLLHTAHYCMLLLIRMSMQALMRWPLFTCSKTNTVTRLLEHVVRTTSQEPLRWQGNPLQSSRAYHMIAVYHNLKNIENQPTSASEMCRACEGQGTAASKHIRAIMLSATFTTSALGMPPAALWFRMPKHSSRFAPSFSTVLKHKRLARASVKLCFLYVYIYLFSFKSPLNVNYR